MKIMRESQIMLLHYITGLGILIAGAIHLTVIFLLGNYDANLAFSGSTYSVINVYKNALLVTSLWALLALVDFHALNGLRVILIEFRQGVRWQRTVTWLLGVLGVLVLIYGTRTILIAYRIVLP